MVKVMSKPIVYRGVTVIITPHSWSRWLERAHRRPYKKSGLKALLETMLDAKLACGQPTVGLTVFLDMKGGIRAVLELTESGWICLTVLGKGEPYFREVG